MLIKSIEISNFKKITSLNTSFSDSINILCGCNASGKTSCLDAIHYLMLLRSTSFLKGERLINDFAEQSLIKGAIDTQKGAKTHIVLISKYGQKTSVSGIETKKLTDYVADSAVVSFGNGDVFSIDYDPSHRRKMFNIILCQCDKEYMRLLSEYKKIVKEKNNLLKSSEQVDEVLFETYCQKQYELLSQIEPKLNNYVNWLNKKINNYHWALSNEIEQTKIEIKSNVRIEQGLEFFLEQCKKEVQYKTCLFGCHRDDYVFYINNQAISDRASQGQIKTLALAFKIACAELIESHTGIKPIVLMDDVFGELDKERQNALMNLLINNSYQTFITTPSISDIDERFLKNANIIYLKEGGICHEFE